MNIERGNFVLIIELHHTHQTSHESAKLSVKHQLHASMLRTLEKND